MDINWRPHRFEIIVVSAIVTGLWMLLFVRVGSIKRGELCQSNLKQIGLATLQYVRDYDEKYPLLPGWSETLYPYSKNASLFHCPAVAQFGYSMNTELASMSIVEISNPAATPMVFESSMLQEFQHDKGESWLAEPRHPQGIGLIYADGRADWRQKPPSFPTLPNAKSGFPTN